MDNTGLRFPLKNDVSRKIIHIDMDAFYASIEERDNPKLKEHPLVIARHPNETGGKGVVTTANYLARQFGIHSAMSALEAYKRCPDAVFIPGNLNYYKEVSLEIRKIFYRYTDLIEPVAFDEAYLDVTENKINAKSAIKVAKLIQRDIYQELHLTCSAGVSYNKFLAKLASDYEKPKGLTVVLPNDAVSFLKKLPIEDFQGIGVKTVPKMHEQGIYTGEDLYEKQEWDLIQQFGKLGYHLYRRVRGIHLSPVQPNRDPKSIGREETYRNILRDETQIRIALKELADDVKKSIDKQQKHGQTVVLKVRDEEFDTITRRVTLREFVGESEEIFFHAMNLWDELNLTTINVRLLGITLTNLAPRTFENMVLPLWEKKEN